MSWIIPGLLHLGDLIVELNNIYKMDCLEGINKMQSGFVSLIITSPPYNLWDSSVYKKVKYNTYNDNKDFDEYITWLKKVFGGCYRILSEDGRIIINIGDQKNGQVPTHYYITKIMFELGFKYYTTIIWNKSQTSRRTAWGSFQMPSCPSFPTPFEYILVFYKNSRKLLHKGVADISKEDFIQWSLSLWNFTPETRAKKFGHPAMFPEELPRRCIQMFSYPEDIIMDPFSGLGTTCYIAKKLNRKFIGFEIDAEYYKLSIERINSI